MAKSTGHNKGFSSSGIMQLVIGLAILVLINYIASILFYRFDLTADKRHTLNDNTVELLENLEDVVFIKVYLKGDFSKEYKRLAQATREKLDILRSYSNGRIEFEFINPSESEDPKVRREFYQQLRKKGLEFTSEPSGAGETGERIIWPGAIITYRDQEIPVQLMRGEVFTTIAENIEKAINNLEYNFSNAIQKFLIQKTAKIALIDGHGELDSYEIFEFKNQLEEYYNVERVQLNGQFKALDGFDAIIVAKPDSTIPDIDKFILDQFIMKGGKSLWLVDPVYASMDSLSPEVSTTLAMSNRLNIEDQLFKYGVNLNGNLIMDMQAAVIPVGDRIVGGEQQFTPYPWFYFPLVMPTIDHPIVNNLDAIKFEFVSSIDTVNNPEIKKTVLLHTSKYSRVLNSPVRVSLNILKVKPKPELFNKPFQPVAVLLEGSFKSVYQFNMPAGLDQVEGLNPKTEGVPNKMIVVSDGDVAKNPVIERAGRIETFPLGYDRFSRQIYSNSTFLLNCMNYLMDDDGLITARAKNQKVRLVDERQIENRGTFWQAINVIAPILFIILFGVIQHLQRVVAYTNKDNKRLAILSALFTALLATTVLFAYFALVPGAPAIGTIAALFAALLLVGLNAYTLFRIYSK